MRRLLREARAEAGLSQADLGKRAGLSQELVSRGETGQRKLDVLDIRALCAAMDVDFVAFMARLHAALCEWETKPRGHDRSHQPPRPERTRRNSNRK